MKSYERYRGYIFKLKLKLLKVLRSCATRNGQETFGKLSLYLNYQRNQAKPVGEELIAENGRVGLKLDPVNSDGRSFSDHDTPDGIGHTHVSVFQLELHLNPMF
jgi:hypothetical protein